MQPGAPEDTAGLVSAGDARLFAKVVLASTPRLGLSFLLAAATPVGNDHNFRSDGTTISQVGSPEAVFCHQVFPFRPDVKTLASYALPYDIIISGTYQLSTGPNILATWNAPNSVIAPALGRNLAACPATGTCTATKSIQLIEPGTVWGDYLQELDLRLSKRFKVGSLRFRGDLNLYNAFNSDFASTVNTTFSTAANNQFLRPTAVIQGRLFKIGGQIDF